MNVSERKVKSKNFLDLKFFSVRSAGEWGVEEKENRRVGESATRVEE